MHGKPLNIAAWLGVAVAVTAATGHSAEQSPPNVEATAEQLDAFENSVRPVLAGRCIKCHGSKTQESGLRLDSRAAALKGGESGPAVVPGNLEKSLLVEAIRYESFEMPPDEQLPDDQIAAIVRWIEAGAAWPSGLTLKGEKQPLTITDLTGDALLGLGMACARCHDHKFDPIPHEDYYRLRAFFEPLVWREDQPQADVVQRAAHAQNLAAWERATAEIRRKLDAIGRPVLLQAAGGQGFRKFAPHLQAMMLKFAEDRTPREHQIASLCLRQLTLDRSKLPEKIPAEQKVEDGWRLKALHRRIMNTAVYRQTALRSTPPKAAQIDPGNRLLWRMNLRRLTAEHIRDAMLSVSGELDLLARLNQRHAAERPGQSELEARIASFELAFRMQAAAPDAVDLAKETEETQRLYGIGESATDVFGRNCLLARRLVERGVRYVQLYSGAGSEWDAHSNIEGNHSKMCGRTDKPIAGLLTDLKRRGLLEQTLVVWGGEFGRTPMSEKGDGRDRNPTGFTMWMAGGGVRGGQAIGTTDEVGLHAVEDRLHVKDVHACILHALGINNKTLTYYHKGRPERPTINEGGPCKKLFG